QSVQAPVESGSSELRYTVAIEGLAAVGNSEELLKAFRQQSALEADRKDSANSAQIDRRSRADADLLAELLRSQGYYDAVVDATTTTVDHAVQVTLTVDAGAEYRFASVELPGLEAAGANAAKLREKFGVNAGDPVIAQDVIAGELALRTALGEEGFAGAEVGEQDIEVNHQTHLATLTMPVNPGPVARHSARSTSRRSRGSGQATRSSDPTSTTFVARSSTPASSQPPTSRLFPWRAGGWST